MDKFFTPLLRRLYVVLVGTFVVVYTVDFFQHTTWNKERNYRRLLTGSRQERLSAAANLVELGGETQLVRALRSHSDTVCDLAEQSLWEVWFQSAGQRAYRTLLRVQHLIDTRHFEEALPILNHLTRQYPRFAEAWDRRGTLHWRRGDYWKSLADFRRVLALNPDHFGAWQGLALCQLFLGDSTSACRSLRQALRIYPRDRVSRGLLRWAEEWLRREPPGSSHRNDLV